MLTIKPRVAATVSIPDTGEKTLFLDETDSILKTKDDVGVVEALAVVDTTEPKVYTALLTQTGTDAPVATVLKNTLEGEVVWTRATAGTYYGTLTGTFASDKTSKLSIFTVKDDVLKLIRGEGLEDWFNLITSDYSDPGSGEDEILDSTYIIIEVYP